MLTPYNHEICTNLIQMEYCSNLSDDERTVLSRAVTVIGEMEKALLHITAEYNKLNQPSAL